MYERWRSLSVCSFVRACARNDCSSGRGRSWAASPERKRATVSRAVTTLILAPTIQFAMASSRRPDRAIDVTQLLHAWRDGDHAAFEQLVEAVYAELHRIARRCMAGERAGHNLQPTALVNEAYMRLVGTQDVQWQNRQH